jgi:hypothetical protein
MVLIRRRTLISMVPLLLSVDMARSIRRSAGQDRGKRTAGLSEMAAPQQEEHRAPARFIAELPRLTG